MKPQSQKSPGCDPGSTKKLSTKMKPRLKSRSSESLGQSLGQPGRRSPVADHLLATSRDGQRKRFTRQNAAVNLFGNTEELKASSVNLSSGCNLTGEQSAAQSSANSSSMLDVSVASRLISRKRLGIKMSTPVTPRIMVSKCEKLERLVEEKDGGSRTTKKVLRAKIKSPVNKIQKSIIERNMKNKDRIESYESQLRKKESEILSLNRKLNSVQKTINDKDKTIKGLELKFPKMINELKQGLTEEKKANVEMKEILKKYRQANGDKKQVEEKLKLKDEKLKEVKASKKKLMDDLKSKDLELNNFRIRLQTLEEKVPQLLEEICQKDEEITSKDQDLVKFEETIEFLEQRLEAQADDLRSQEKLIDDLKRRLNECSEEIDSKENEILDLRASHCELQEELQEQYEALEKTDQETKNYLQIIDSIRERIDVAPATAEKLHNSIDYLDKATADYLDKVSSVSKKKNMSFKVKLTVTKTKNRGGRQLQGLQANETFDSIILNPNSFNNNNSSRFSFHNIKHSSRNSGRFSQENMFKMSNSFNHSRVSLDEGRKHMKLQNGEMDSLDEVFADNAEDSLSRKTRESKGSLTAESSLFSEASKSEYDVSSDTCNRFEELDNKVQNLWNKLSTKDESFEVFKSNTKTHFTSSVSKMKDDLSNSLDQHNRFLNQVRVAKKLFSSPTPGKLK